MAAPTAPIVTAFDFELPRGYVDDDGVVHKRGTMRLATARDELLPLSDMRVKDNPAYLSIVLLSRVVTRLGTLPHIYGEIIENLFASDLAFLQDLYRRINQEGHTHASVRCPACEQHLHGGRGRWCAGGILTYAADRLYEETAYVAYHFHWSLDEILDLDHPTRRRFVDEIASINQRANEPAR